MILYLIPLAICASFVSRSLGGIFEILSIVGLLTLIKTKKVSSLQLASFKLWSISVLVVVSVSLFHVFSSDIKASNLSILRHNFFPLCLVWLFYSFKERSLPFDKIYKHSLVWASIGIILAFIACLIEAWGMDQGLINSLLNKRLKGLTTISGLAYTLSTIYPLFFCYFLNELSLVKSNKHRNKQTMYSSLFVLLIIILSVFFTKSRGPLLTILLISPFCLFFFFRKTFYASMTFSIATVLFFIYIISSPIQTSSRYFQAFNSYSNKARIAQYKTASLIIKDSPLLGVGLKKYPIKSKEYKEKFDLEYIDHNDHAHNSFLHVSAESGVVFGVLFFLTFLFLFYESLFLVREKIYKASFSSVFLVFLLQSFLDHMYHMFFAVLISAIIGLFWVYHLEKKSY